MQKNKKITTDELAVMINNGFKGVDKKFEKITEDLSEKFDKIDEKFEGVNKKLDTLQSDLTFLTDTTKRGFDEVGEKFRVVDEKFEALDNKLSKKIDNVGHGLNILVDVLEDNRAINTKDVKKVRFAAEVGK